MFEAIIALLVVIGGLFFKTRLDKNKIDNQAEEIHMFEKKAEIIEDMGLAEVKAEKKADESIKDINTDNWRNRI